MARRAASPAEAAVANYLSMSDHLLEEAQAAQRHGRPVLAAHLREQSRIARRAAWDEERDVQPLGLPEAGS